MSFDTMGCRYAATVQTNGQRVEMITKTNIDGMLGLLFTEWVTQVGKGQLPQHIYYFRDGVSEGQYAHVLDQEITNIREFIATKYNPEVAQKVSLPPQRALDTPDMSTDQVYGHSLHKAPPYSLLP